MVKLFDLFPQKGKFATKGHISTNSLIPSIYYTKKFGPQGEDKESKTLSLQTWCLFNSNFTRFLTQTSLMYEYLKAHLYLIESLSLFSMWKKLGSCVLRLLHAVIQSVISENNGDICLKITLDSNWNTKTGTWMFTAEFIIY